MKVPFSWLKEYVDIDVTAQELEDKLFGCGFEVEELIDLSAEIDRVAVSYTHLPGAAMTGSLPRQRDARCSMCSSARMSTMSALW